MSGVAGHTASVKRSGTPTGMSSEAMSTLGSSVEYIIDDTSKRVWDFAQDLTFTDGGSTISSTNIASISRLFGVVTFNNAPSSDVRVTGNYLPLSNVTGANSVSVALNKTLLDDTDFESSGYVSRHPGLKDASVTLSRWDDVSTEFTDTLLNDNDVIIEVRLDGSSNSVIKGIFATESENRSADPASLVSADITLQLNSTSTSPPIDIRVA